MRDYIIGAILKNGEIVRGLSEQGDIYKNSKAFYKKLNEVCYISELSDDGYTYEDFLNLANGSEEVASMLFDTIGWQSPRTLLLECLSEDKVHYCLRCNKMYLSYNVEYCPYCGQRKEIHHAIVKNKILHYYKVEDVIYEVLLYKESLEKLNWSWESLIFPESNEETFAIVTNNSTGEWSYLSTNGFVRIVDTLEERNLSVEEISNLAIKSEIYDERYFIDNNNWFALEHLTKDDEKIDDNVFESEPKSFEELAHCLLEYHLHYFQK